MNRTRTSPILAALLVGASLVACSSKSGAKPDTSSSASESTSESKSPKPSGSGSAAMKGTAPTSEPAKPSAPVDPNGPGPAVLYFSEAGTYLLDAGKLTKIGDYTAESVEVTKDGKAYISGIEAFVVEGGVAKKFEAPSAELTVGGDGSLWSMIGFQHEVAKLGADGQWAKEKVPGSDDALFMKFAVDAKGDVYITASDKLFTKKGGAWSTVEFKTIFKEEPLYVSGLTLFGGEVYLISNQGVKTVDGKEIKLPKEYGTLSVDGDVARASDGTLAFHSTDTLFTVAPDGKITQKKLAELPVKGSIVEAFAVDNQGRKWIGAGDQLYILGKDDKAIQTWPVGSIPGTLRFVQVLGAGPELPPAPDPVVKANVKGRLVVDGAPVKSTEIVACGSPSMFITGATPCSGATVELAGKTDDDGVFTFKDVPRGHYGLAWKEGGKWKLTLGMSGVCCTKIKNGEDFDMKEVQVKSN